MIMNIVNVYEISFYAIKYHCRMVVLGFDQSPNMYVNTLSVWIRHASYLDARNNFLVLTDSVNTIFALLEIG